MRKSVVLPAPEPPMMTAVSPRRTVIDTPRSTSLSPKRLITLSTMTCSSPARFCGPSGPGGVVAPSGPGVVAPSGPGVGLAPSGPGGVAPAAAGRASTGAAPLAGRGGGATSSRVRAAKPMRPSSGLEAEA